MTAAFISDIHLNAARPDSLQRFKRFLNEHARQLAQLYILGDLFDYWVGDDGVHTLNFGDAEKAIRSAADTGTQVFFLRGNRDFLIGDAFAHRTACTLLPDPSVAEVQGRKLLLTHGDALCTDDTAHQQSRAQLLSGKWQAAFLNKPLDERVADAKALRKQSEIAKRTKTAAMMDVTQSAVTTIMNAHGVDTLIHGHTHRPGVHQFTIGGKPARRYVLGDWHHRANALYCRDGQLAMSD